MENNGLFEKIETHLSGCYEIIPVVRGDIRGSFIKTFHEPAFKELELETNFKEEYFSTSKKNVIRGLHFQIPPEDHVKLVYCAEGNVMDVAVDLRKSSQTYGKFHISTLNSQNGNMIYIPKGFAHGFCAISDIAVIVCKTTTVYSAAHDKGILWNSVNIPWKCDEPILSEKDKLHPTLAEFNSPF